MRSGNAEFYNKFFDENFENSENNAPAGRRYSAKNSENPVLKNGEIFTNWEDFAQKKGLPAGGAILAGLYALWRRRKKEKVTLPADVGNANNLNLFQDVLMTKNKSWRNFYNEVRRKISAESLENERNFVKNNKNFLYKKFKKPL